LFNNKKYWDKFYCKDRTSLKPSSFAKFCYKKIINQNTHILDIGCGNGRDAFYFIKKNLLYIGIDSSKIIIKKLKKKNKDFFFHIDACKKIKKNFFNYKFNYIYMRFFIHAISLKDEKKLFENVLGLIKKNGSIFIEYRTNHDPLSQKGKIFKDNISFTDHYRRFIDSEKFSKRLLSRGFEIKYFKEGFNLSKYKNENPHIARMVLTVKK
jgi:cyclopropane fatty-acyl-phospholipid synthase-like methyltransferase